MNLWNKFLSLFRKKSKPSVTIVIKDVSTSAPMFVENNKQLQVSFTNVEDVIISLRKLNKTNKEICDETGLSLNQVKYIIQKLLKEGKIERKKK